jgi:hypothetical protein
VSTSFTRTRLQVAQRVLGKVTKMSPAQASVASADLDTVYEAIDLRLKELHKLDVFWRKVTSVPVTFSLSAGVATASAGAGDILFPMKVTFTNGPNDDPVYIIGIKEYAEIVDKTRTGNPEKVLWKGGSEFIFYPVPSANGTAKLLYEKIADDTTAGSAMDVDVSMIRPMVDIIKYDIADDYGVDETTQVRWRAECEKAERDIRKLGAPKTDLLPVQVDDFDNRQPNSRQSSDY